MSKISIEGNALGSGTLTIAAPNTNSNFTLTLPENTGTIVTTAGASALTTSGNLAFTGTGNRITGDFSNATVASRVTFQGTTTNANTTVQAIPNGTAVNSGFLGFNNSDPTNAAFIAIATSAGTEARLTSGITGTGTFLPMTFFTGGSERMRIDTSGNVGIGTSSPSTKLHVAAAANSGLLVSSTDGTTFKGIAFNTTDNQFTVGTQTNHPMAFFTNNAERMRIDSSGSLILVGSTAQKATGTTWSNPSDERLKDHIRDYGKGIAELMQVRVREWEYNGKGGTVEGTKGMGVVADEVMVVLPDTVENYEAKLNADDEEVTAIKKFDATEITWLLVKSIQELKAELDTVKAELATLKG